MNLGGGKPPVESIKPAREVIVQTRVDESVKREQPTPEELLRKAKVER